MIAYVRSPDIVLTERTELFDPIDLLATFGGIVGLFLGVSIVNIIEIGYYCIVRPLIELILIGVKRVSSSKVIDEGQKKQVTHRKLKLRNKPRQKINRLNRFQGKEINAGGNSKIHFIGHL